MAECERTPLLLNQNTRTATREVPPPYSACLEAGAETFHDTDTVPVATDDLPPPYTPQGGILTINCKVCQAVISLEGKEHLYIVKCLTCNEITPLREAPPGKKYIRCICNLLLVCRSSATKVLCPRETCKRVITLPGTDRDLHHLPLVPRYMCAYCNQIFILHVITKFTRCPHCRKLSSVGCSYARTRGYAYFIIGVLFLGASISVMILTYDSASDHEGIFVAWIGGFALSVLFLGRAFYYFALRTSPLVQPSFLT